MQVLQLFAALVRYWGLWLRYPALRRQRFYLGAGADVRVERSATVAIGRHVRAMRDFTAHIAGNLRIGDDVFFNRGCHLVVLDAVTIGAGCLFGEGVSIHDEQHVVAAGALPIAQRGFVTEAIRIEEGVWVGAKATITAGVTIGRNSVIGANAVVTHDIPAGAVAAGVPAHVIRTHAPSRTDAHSAAD